MINLQQPPLQWGDRTYSFYYLAGLFVPLRTEFHCKIVEDPLPPGVLISYANIFLMEQAKKGNIGSRFYKYLPVIEKVRDKGGLTMLDSGAFTVFQDPKYGSIDVKKYADFCIAYSDLFNVAASVDVIGDPTGTADNLKWLEDYGVQDYLKLLPAFHYGTGFDELFKLSERYDYIGLGGIAKMNATLRQAWLRKVASFNLPVKYHLFGIATWTEIDIIKPFSIDNSKWSSCTRFFKLIIGDETYSFRNARNAIYSPQVLDRLNRVAAEYGYTLDDLNDNVAIAIVNWYQTMKGYANRDFLTKPKKRQIFFG